MKEKKGSEKIKTQKDNTFKRYQEEKLAQGEKPKNPPPLDQRRKK